MRTRWLLEATGAALLFLLPDFCSLVLPRNIALYHHQLPLTHVVDGLLLDLLGAAIAATILVLLVSRLPVVPRRILGAGFAALICWRAAEVPSTVLGLWKSHAGPATRAQEPGPVWPFSHFWVHSARFGGYGLVFLFVSLAWLKPKVAGRAVRTVRLGLAAFSFCAIWIVPSLLAVAFARPLKTAPAQASTAMPHAHHRRIVWILFDELSYNLLFDHHPQGIPTPNFSQLHSQSISFADLAPVGFYTDRVVPSLLAGYRIDKIASTTAGRLLYPDERDRRWRAYDPRRTLLALARSEGWNPGVAGWYMPYCRTFASVLSSCSWTPGIHEELPTERDGASESNSALGNALIMPEVALARLVSRRRAGSAGLLAQNIRDYLEVMNNARDLIADGNVRFVFLHLPVPHPPGVYNRGTHQLSASGNYLDNLVLADDTLRLLRDEIAGTPWAGDTTLIVSSDHSWRVPMWRASPGWTAEEERISQGRFDSRPVFLVHFPGQASGIEIRAPLSELVEHQVIAGMLTSRLQHPDSLRALPVLSSPPGKPPGILVKTRSSF